MARTIDIVALGDNPAVGYTSVLTVAQPYS